MIVFRPDQADDGVVWRERITTTRLSDNGTAACVLAPSIMSQAGGSLVVEARENHNSPTYWLHWAGAQTSDGAEDCGSQANLIISRFDLQKLANAAGGFGIRKKMMQNRE